MMSELDMLVVLSCEGERGKEDSAQIFFWLQWNPLSSSSLGGLTR